MLVLLLAAILSFGMIERSFFPDSTRPQFLVDLWLREGTDISQTVEAVAGIERHLAKMEGVTQVVSLVGRGAPRFLLTYAAQEPVSSYAQLLVSVDDYHIISELAPRVQSEIETQFPHVQPVVFKFMLGPGDATKIQVRFSGPDTNELRRIAGQAMDIMHADGGMIGVQTDWRDRVKVLRPRVADAQARYHGIERPDIARALQENFDGTPVGVFRDGKDLLPIVSRAPRAEREDVTSGRDLRIWSPAAGKTIPISQIVTGFDVAFEDPRIYRRNSVRTITVKCNPREGNASIALARVKAQIDAIDLLEGYAVEWGGELESSGDAQAALAAKLPIFIILMVLIVIFLFNNLRQPLIIWLCVPLAIIGVTAGLLLTGQPFGFMALLGLLSLIGMLIKNAIVLIDQINLETREGRQPYEAVVLSGVSRMRPVLMAAATTVLGMIPLLFDAFFVAMAVTIMAGLTFASILTLLVLPVLYVILYRIESPEG